MEKDYLKIFNDYYKSVKKKIVKEMDKYNKKLIKDDDNEIVRDLLNDFIDLNSDGKCIRGMIIALAYSNYVENNKYLPLAVAYETFQTSALIEDDITDKSDERRGKRTLHMRVKDKYKKYDNALELGNNLALWTSNIGYFLVNNIIIENYKENKNVSLILKTYNDIAINTIKGQVIDIDLPFKAMYLKYNTLESDVLEIYKLKTADYTLVGPYKLGLSILGKKLSKNLEKALQNIGIAFQIKDDILGVFGESNVIGKPNVSDIEEFKQTILYTYTINTKYKNKLLKYYGKKINEKDLDIVRNIFIESGSLNYAEELMNKLLEEGRELIEKDTTLKVKTKEILYGLIIYLRDRKK